MPNVEFELAEQFALQTHKHCFVTGKAGTGKTTLLRRLAQRTQKNVVVVAPTGVAAVNAGGVTIHSMFGLPLTCFVPSDDFVDPNLATNRYRLHENLRLRSEKLRVLREMDLLIVDEVSMVRCDTLDAIDLVLRTVRGKRQPFGDVQVLLIGDVHQLPPVAKDAEWNILKAHYRSPYFFDSLVWPQLDAVQIELQMIYRQSDERFLSLLDNIRNRKLDADDSRRLRERYDPEFKPPEPGYVLLATHNRKADSVNSSELTSLPGTTHSFAAQIEGEFPEHLFPCDAVLHLKIGAQVMFIRNDSEAGAYFNGKLALVKQIGGADITVTFRDSGQDYTLHREIWENIGYGVEEESSRVVRQKLGTFSQYPLRLAWAITIHKSQGLTFDKIIVDAGQSFAAGQVYVALSRCRSLEGIVLHSLITPNALHDDPRIGEFSALHHAAAELQGVLVREKTRYANYLLLRLFTFAELSAHLDDWRGLIAGKKLPDKQAATVLLDHFRTRTGELNATADKFQRQLRRLLEATQSDPNSATALRERCGKAIAYFTEQIATQLIEPLHSHIAKLADKKKLKRYVKHVQLIEANCWSRIDRLYGARFIDENIYSGEVVYTKDMREPVAVSITSGSKAKGSTVNETFDLYRQGKTADEIAAIRGLSVSTIKGHFARLIERGEMDVYKVLTAEAIELVLAFLRENAGGSVTAIRSGTGDRFDYGDIRMIVAHHSRGIEQGSI
jgi:DNA-binding CsgD family transcriptional regulator